MAGQKKSGKAKNPTARPTHATAPKAAPASKPSTGSENRFSALPVEQAASDTQEQGSIVAPEQVTPAPPPKVKKISKFAYGRRAGDSSDEEETAMDVDKPETAVKEPTVSTPRIWSRALDSVPDNFRFKEFSDRKDVDPFPVTFDGYDVSVIHKAYRGSDKIKIEKFKHGLQPAQVMFMEEMGSADPKSKGHRVCHGILDMQHGVEEGLIKVSFEMDSQIPSVVPDVARPGYKEDKTVGSVDFHIFANSIVPAVSSKDGKGREKREPAGISLRVVDKLEDDDIPEFEKYIARGHSNLNAFATSNNLMMMNVQLIKPEPTSKDRYRCRPIWSGISSSGLQQIRDMDKDEKLRSGMTPFERTILLLDRSQSLAIFRRVECGNRDLMKTMINFFMGSMHLASAYRNFWYFQLQLQKPTEGQKLNNALNIFHPDCRLEDLEPPRWMITKFMGYSSVQGGTITKVEPLNWTVFSKRSVYPTVLDCGFEVRLALARERNNQKHVIKAMETSAKDGCKARFQPIEGIDGGYTLRISYKGLDPGMMAELIKPELDTRIKVTVEVSGGDIIRYQGTVIESPGTYDAKAEESKDYDFVAQALGRKYDFGDSQLPITLEFIDDDTTANRARTSTENMMATKLKRDVGVDISSLIFRTRSTIALGNQNAGIAIADSTMADITRRCERFWKLNKEQIRAMHETFQSSSGLGLIYGPPGTGKTATTATAAVEHCMLGHKVIFTCSSNKAVDAALAAFQARAGRTNTEIRAIRFVGGYQTLQKHGDTAVPGTGLKALEGLANPTLTATMKANPGTIIHLQLNAAIKKWAQNPSHAQNSNAKEYLDVLAKVGKLSGQQVSQNKKTLSARTEDLTDHFIQHEVDIIFTTCASACHPVLAFNFKPSVAFIDDAGQAPIPDVCMALESYKESVKWLIMSGDYNQLPPVVTATANSEVNKVLEDSLFRQLVRDSHRAYPHVMLNEQYRQHPDLSDWPNEFFYDNKLINAPITINITRKGYTLRQYFSQLGAARVHERCRMAIDVSGPNAISKPYNNTTSFCNEEETRIIVGLVRGILTYVPKFAPNQAGKYDVVVPQDFAIITPYKGQQRLLRNKLRANGLSCLEGRVILEGTVSTTWGIQGSQAIIAIVSLCVRDPENATKKTKFIAKPNSLCVQNTRAQQFQVTTGNFKGWLEALFHGANKGTWASGYYNAFRKFIHHHNDKKDIVSWEDVDRTLLAPAGKMEVLQDSHFYKNVLPTLKPGQVVGKRKRDQKKKYDQDTRPLNSMGEMKDSLPSESAVPKIRNAGETSLNKYERKVAKRAATQKAKDDAEASKKKTAALLDTGRKSKLLGM